MKDGLVGMHVLVVMLAALGWPSSPARAAESYDNCTGFIDTLPATIGAQGTWCLRHDLSTALASGVAIDIQANNVTIDCNDFKIGGLAAGMSTSAEGIHADDRLNVAIRNCTIRGFRIGINIQDGGGNLIEDNRLESNRAFGMYVKGDGSVVRRNRVLDTGGHPNSNQVEAVFVHGSGCVLSDNLVMGVSVAAGFTNGNSIGINLSGGPHNVVGNTISGVIPNGAGTARGIWGDVVPISVSGNSIISAGSVNGTGILGGHEKSTCRDNTVTNFTAGASSCVDAGGNNYN